MFGDHGGGLRGRFAEIWLVCNKSDQSRCSIYLIRLPTHIQSHIHSLPLSWIASDDPAAPLYHVGRRGTIVGYAFNSPLSYSSSAASSVGFRRSSASGASSHGLGSRSDYPSINYRDPLLREPSHRESLPSRLYPSRSPSHHTLDRRSQNDGLGGRVTRDEQTNSLLERYGSGGSQRKSSIGENPTLQYLKQRRQQQSDLDNGFTARKQSLDGVGYAGVAIEGIFGSSFRDQPGTSFGRESIRQTPADAQDLNQNEYMSRLMAAHNRVDELLRSRGLPGEDERKYLRAWEEIPIPVIREERLRRLRTPSSSSDSGLSTDNDSDRSNAEAVPSVINVPVSAEDEETPEAVEETPEADEPEEADSETSISGKEESEESACVIPLKRSLERVTFTCTASVTRRAQVQLKLEVKSPFKRTTYTMPMNSSVKESAEVQCMAATFVNDNCSKVLRGVPARASLTSAFPLKVAWSRVRASFEEANPVQSPAKNALLQRRKTYEENVGVQQKNVLASLKRKKLPAVPSTAEISIQHCSFYTQTAKDNFSEKNVRINLRLTERAPKDCTAVISLPAPPKVAYARLDVVIKKPEPPKRSQTSQLPRPAKKVVGKLDRSFTTDLSLDKEKEQRKVNRLIIPEYFLQSSAEALEDLKGMRDTLKRVPIIGGFLVTPKPKGPASQLRRAGAIRRRPPPSKEHTAPYLDFLPPTSPGARGSVPEIRIQRPPDPDPPPIPRQQPSNAFAGYLNLHGSLERSATSRGAVKYESKKQFAELSETDRILIEQYRRKLHIPCPRAIIRALSPIQAIKSFTAHLKERCQSPPRAKFIQRAPPRQLRPKTPVRAESPPRLHRVVPLRSTVQRANHLDLSIQLKRVDIEKHKLRKKPLKRCIKWIPRWRKKCTDEEVEEVEEEEEEEQEQQEKPASIEDKPERPKTKSITAEEDVEGLTEGEKAMAAAKRRHEEEQEAKLMDYEERRRIEREKEEEELKKLKEKQERRKLEREQEEKEQEERRRTADERRRQEEEERKARVEEEKRKKEEERNKRSAAIGGSFNPAGGRNFTIPKKSEKSNDKFGNIVQAKQEMGMTKDQQDEAKRVFMAAIRKGIPESGDILPADLKAKIKELHQRICKLEADKYDLEKRHERQAYDLKELNERQRQVARHAALKKGIDPAEASNSRYPAKVQIVSKYDRQIDRRNFRERRSVFDNKNGYPCFPGVPPPPAIYEKVILAVEAPEEEAAAEEEE
ncbi:unnamed protein product [Caenorhabditis auriculariae]|uniref:Troponin T n=1 Tax=Caenorhabditis auriculariae TaxID=2777116 RepID=A0A8S1GZ95_9PELO|nr:unnamed protein product [Caenorhabditis auriculariae]